MGTNSLFSSGTLGTVKQTSPIATAGLKTALDGSGRQRETAPFYD